MPSRLNHYSTAFGEPGAAVADDVHLGTKHNSASGSSLCLLEKMENKKNCSQYILGLNLFFFVTGVRVNFSKINFDRALLTTVNSLLKYSFERNLQYFKQRRGRLLCGRAACILGTETRYEVEEQANEMQQRKLEDCFE